MRPYERTCVICEELRDLNENVFIDPSREHSIFQTVCTYLSVTEESCKLWNFQEDPLPFCPQCKEVVLEVYRLTKQIALLKNQVKDKVGMLREAVLRIGTKVGNPSSRNLMDESLIRDWGTISLDFTNLMESSVEQPTICTDELTARYIRFREEASLKNDGAKRVSNSVICQPTEPEASQKMTTEDGVEEREMSVDEQNAEAENVSEVLVGSFPDADSSNDQLPLELASDLSDESNSEGCQLYDTLPSISKQETNGIPTQGWQEKEDGTYFMNTRTIEENNEMRCLAEDCLETVSLMKENYKKRMAYHIKKEHYGLKKCPVVGCTRRFIEIKKIDLENHIEKVHTSSSSVDSKPFEEQRCKACNRLYTSMRYFKNHVRNCCPTEYAFKGTPTKKEFPCSACPKKFSTKSNLERHFVRHIKPIDERREHLCEACGKGFTLKGGLKEHLRDVHSIT